MFKNLTEYHYVWAWRLLVLICAIVTACSVSFIASSIFVAQVRLYQMTHAVTAQP